MLHLGKNNPKHTYTIKHGDGIETIDLKITTCEKDMGVNVDPLMNFEDHIAKQCKKARGMAAMILKNDKKI